MVYKDFDLVFAFGHDARKTKAWNGRNIPLVWCLNLSSDYFHFYTFEVHVRYFYFKPLIIVSEWIGTFSPFNFLVMAFWWPLVTLHFSDLLQFITNDYFAGSKKVKINHFFRFRFRLIGSSSNKVWRVLGDGRKGERLILIQTESI